MSVTSMTVGNRKFPRVHRLALNVSDAMTTTVIQKAGLSNSLVVSKLS
jgi:hypothetical protein